MNSWRLPHWLVASNRSLESRIGQSRPLARGVSLILLACSSVAASELRLARPFTHHAVFQRDRIFPVFGTDLPGTTVTVTLGDVTRTAIADRDGKWRVNFPALAANAVPRELSVNGTDSITLTNLLIGDVWLISGQSNADWPLRSATEGAQAVAAATNALVRYLQMAEAPVTTPSAWSAAQIARLQPGQYFSGEWQVISPATAGAVSAIGYFFARHLATNRNLPIGLIDCAVGGTPAESWIPPAAIATNPRLALMASNYLDSPMVAAFVTKRIRQNLAEWDKGGRASPMPDHPYLPGACWRLGLAGVAPFAIRGVLWYQGETNADFYDPAEFDDMAAWHADAFRTLVMGWRRAWENDDLPFFAVQLPLMHRPSWPWFRESQAKCAQTIPHCALAVAYDLGTPNDVHPRDLGL